MRARQMPWGEPRETFFAARRAKGDAFGPESVAFGPSRGSHASRVARKLPRATADAAEHPEGESANGGALALGALYDARGTGHSEGDGLPAESVALGASCGTRAC